MNKTDELFKLIKDNPGLPIVPMVESEIVADDCGSYWLGSWGTSKVTEYYCGRERVHFKDDDMEDVLSDMDGCMYGMTEDGRDIYDDLTDDDWQEIWEALPWIKAIVVYINTP